MDREVELELIDELRALAASKRFFLDEAVARRTITLMAPSKTWNIPALYCAFAIIPDPALRRRYRHAMRGIVPHVNVLGMVAAEAAYRDGDAWRRALLDYLRGNRERVLEAVAAMPGLSATRPEATYLAWIDCREMMAERGVTDPAAFFEAAGVGLSDGTFFGAPGFVRLNFGCPRATLDAALRWLDVVAVACVGGIGFTVALLIGELSFEPGSPDSEAGKAAILVGSLLSALLGGLLLAWRSRVHRASAIGADDVQVRTQEDPPHNG